MTNNKKNFKPKSNPRKGKSIKSRNDVEWYNNHPQLLKDAASLSFNSIYGMKTEILPNDTTEFTGDPTDGTIIPGIMCIRYRQTVGVSRDGASEVNNTSRLIYSFIRHANSGSRNYEAPDYMMYLISMGGVYIFYAELVRLYGILRSYSVLNRYIGKACVSAMGYDYDNLINNLASLRYYINSFAIRANAFAVPKNFKYYDRITSTPLHIFKDATNDKSGLYLFRPVSILAFSGTTETTGSSMLEYDLDMNNLADIQNFGDELLNSLLRNEDIGIMSGDTLKAFGSEGCRVLAEIPENYATVPVYDEGYLGQIHNTIPLSVEFLPTEQGSVVYQEDGYIVSNLYHRTSIASGSDDDIKDIPFLIGKANFLMDCGLDNPGPEMVMEFSRLRPSFSGAYNRNSYYIVPLKSAGPEVVTSIQIYALSDQGAIEQVATGASPVIKDVSNNSVPWGETKFAKYKQIFDWAPIQYEYILTDGGSAILYPMGELFNFTPVSNVVVSKLNSAAMLSLFYVPGMGVVV